ncbi:MAG TPA: cation:proton antiporter [Dehalococcoidia bacterium]|nr:cation:proton antiporter [Dehalococcoidia bacterium]
MGQESSLLVDVGVALAIALAAGWLASRLRLPSIVGYIVAGVVISPFTPGFVGDVERLRLIAEIGVVLLLFSIGVQFSIADLARLGGWLALAAVAQIAGVFAAGWALFAALGLSHDEALYLGAAFSISSGVVLVRSLAASAEIDSEHGRVAVGWSVVQDLAVVVLIVVLAAFTEGAAVQQVARDMLLAAVKATAFVAAVLIVGLRVVPLFLNQIAEERSRELFFIAIAALVIGTALASEYIGLSLAIGAFLAGIVVSESDLSYRVLGDLLPTRDVFAVLFFVSAGMLIDPAVIVDEWASVLLALAIILLLKPVVTYALARRTGRSERVSALTAALLAPAGEFSFVLARDGLQRDVISDDVFSVVLTAAVISIVLSPLIVRAAHAWSARGWAAAPLPAANAEEAPVRVGRRAVICGFGRVGEIVATILSNRFSVLIVEEDRRLAREARERGFEVLEGAPASPSVLERMDLRNARVLIVTLPDPFATRLLVERARAINPRLDVIARASLATEAQKLYEAGVTEAVVPDDEVALELARHSLHRFGLSAPEALAAIQGYRARLRERRL